MRTRHFRSAAIAALLTILVAGPALAVTIGQSRWDWFEAIGRVRVSGRLVNPERGYKGTRVATLEATIVLGQSRQLVERFRVPVLPDSDAEFEHDTYDVTTRPADVRILLLTVE